MFLNRDVITVSHVVALCVERAVATCVATPSDKAQAAEERYVLSCGHGLAVVVI